MNEHNQLRY